MALGLDTLLLTGGITFLVAGAYLVVESGSSLAKRMGISPLWVGLTIVAFGTSAPELVVSVLAAAEGADAVAMGNVVGSNILNVLIVLGATSALRALPVATVTLRRDVGLLVGVGIAVWLISMDGELHRGEGLLMLLAVIPYMIHVYREEKRGWLPVEEPPAGFDRFAVALQVVALVVGLGFLVTGGRGAVMGATGLAADLGVSERVVGLTVVAIGTGLPELVTSMLAAWRGKVDMAVGNIIGSNILNLLLVLGAAAGLYGVGVERATSGLDLPFMVLTSLVLYRFAATQGRISRLEGGLLLLLYGAYAAVVVVGLL